MTQHKNGGRISSFQRKLESRLFNTIKLRASLIKIDAVLRPSSPLWILFPLVACFPYFWAPGTYELPEFHVVLSTIFFAIYYMLIGFFRRVGDEYLLLMCDRHSEDVDCTDMKKVRELVKRPYKSEDDPPIVRFMFWLTSVVGLPRRGLMQATVVFAQYVVLGCYIYFFVGYLNGTSPHPVPDGFWKIHGGITLCGLLMMIKNATFLITTKEFIDVLVKVLELKLGHQSVDVVTGSPRVETIVESQMRDFRFEKNKPLHKGCDNCVDKMSKHVASEVPMVIVPSMDKAELLAKLAVLRDRSPQFAATLSRLYDTLTSEPDRVSEVLEEFRAIVLRSPELIQAFKDLGTNNEPPK